jgi:hypothetical protein
MAWLWLILAILALFLLASYGRKQKQRATVAAIRRQFTPVARMRLVAACPALDGVLRDTELRLLFDWILTEMYRRTGTSGFAELMQWSIKRGEAEAERLTAEITREAVERLPQPVLAVIDDCHGRMFAAVVLDESLTAAGQRIGPEFKRTQV